MDLQDAVALSTLSGLTRVRAFSAYKELLESSGDASLEEVIACCAPDANVSRIAAEGREQAAALLVAARAGCITPIRADSEMYPALLRTIADPPPILWLRGSADALV